MVHNPLSTLKTIVMGQEIQTDFSTSLRPNE
jgi:hypothetical protein